MKKSTKLLSVLLALVMVISVIPISASARAIPASTTTVETLISNNSLANLVEYLIKNINNRKDDITGTVLRAVFLAAGDTFNIPKETDVTALSDEQCATLLLDWLDKNIPQWASSLTENKYYGLITGAANLLGIDLDLSDVNGALQTLGSAAKAVKGKNSYGILQHLSPDALIKSKTLTSTTYIKRSDGDLFVVKQLIQFINDAIPALKEAVKGNLNLGSLINNFADLSEYESLIKELPKLIKSYLYLLIDGNAAAGNFKAGETSGDWGTSAYKGYNADQLLAAALIRFVNDNDDVVTTAEADKALKLSFYEILSTYAPVLYKNFAVDFLNDNIQGLIDKLSNVNAEIRGQFKETIPTFDENTFADIFNNASSNGFLGQLNNILVKIAELVLAPEAYKAMDLVSGDNSNLNSNLTKFCRYTLPLLFEIEDQLGFSFPDTVKKNYKTLSLSEMAVYILKPFYTTWFKNSSAAAVDSADTLADLAALAVYYTATNSDWLNIDYNFDSIKSEIFAKDGKMNALTADECTQLVLKTAVGIGVGALQHNADKIYFNVTVDNSNWEKAVDQVSNWGLDFIKGLPALVKVHDIRNQDGNGAFYKLNVLLNEFVNFSFLNDVGNETFKLDAYTVLADAILGNLYNFNFEGMVAVFEKNDNSDNILSANFISSVLGVVDRVITAMFEHSCNKVSPDPIRVPAEGKEQCTHEMVTTYTYCDRSGAYFSKTTTKEKRETAVHNYTTTTKTVDVTPSASTCGKQTQTTKVCSICGDKSITTTKNNHKNYETVKTIPATCGENGKNVLKCSDCGYVHEADNKNAPATGKHTWDSGKVTKAPTTTAEGVKTYTCSVCKTTKTEKIAKLPSGPKYSLGDVDDSGDITAADARLALRRAVNLESFAAGSAKFLACDIDKDNEVTAGDARIILRIAVGLEKISDYNK